MTINEFAIKSQKIHGDRYDYTESVYMARKRKLIIICSIHGRFLQTPADHWRGRGCRKCGLIKIAKESHQKLIGASQLFVRCANKIHNNKYDYKLANYCGNKHDVIIICPQHGQFAQSPASHLSGRGCPLCGRERSRHSHLCDQDEFLIKCRAIHDNYYDYSRVSYTDIHNTIVVICPKHGEFRQLAYVHAYGGGCKLCGVDSTRLSCDEFASRAMVAHGTKYDYSLINYINTTAAVDIICPKHGLFKQAPHAHLRGHGCRKCNMLVTANQIEIANFISQFNNNYILNDRSVIAPYEIDIYIPSLKFGIEHHGAWWHSCNQYDDKKRFRHQLKAKLAVLNGIKLFQIYDFEWHNKRPIVESMIQNACGRSCMINARTLDCNIISTYDADHFMDNNHLYGGRSARINLALLDGADIMICMTFCKHHKHEWEIIRLATALGYCVRGGAAKLLTYFKRKFEPTTIMAYADGRFSSGGVYERLGFVKDGLTKPNYHYVCGSSVFTRQQFQKSKLINKLQHFDENLSEATNMYANGYKRLWDAGHHKFIYKNQPT